ncbi:hypothetical protein HD806DRAFT_540710 [Xylariaceae sp. AK1471]|nr:hypothetical protein HD806DRAFT_540710 [Xylariaceae sp. AK1471]
MSATDAPPSYDEVVNHLTDKLKNVGPKDTEYVAGVLESLPPSYKQVLAEHAKTADVSLTPEQDENMGGAMIDAAHTNYVVQNVKLTAAAATKAVKGIEEDFSKLLQKLSTIDTKYPNQVPKEGKFVPRLLPIQGKFRKIVQESRMLAVEIAVYGQSFDETIAPLVQDKDLKPELRLSKLQQFIKEADNYKLKSGDINAQYQGMKTDMDIFTGTFTAWSVEREEQLDKELEQIRKDIIDLLEEIKAKTTAMLVLGVVAAASLPVTVVIAAMSGLAAPVVIVIGLIVAGVTAITAVALAFVISSLKNQLAAKQQQEKDKNKEKKELQTTRNDLVELGKSTLADFKSNVDILAAFWISAEADAKLAEEWLKGGEKVADIPKYLKKQTDPAINIYKEMARYLTEYAKGIDDSGIPKQ